MEYTYSIFVILFLCFVGIIQADNNIYLNLNYKYYIISMKDASKYSFNIQPTKQNESLLRKRGEIPKFNAINIKKINEIINSKDCISRLYNGNVINNDAETSLCNLRKLKNHFDNNKSGNKTISDKIDFEVLVKELEPEESFVNKQYELLAEIIIDNLDSYEKDDLITEEIHNLFRKRSKTTVNDIIYDKNFEKILAKAYNILDVTVFYGYLSDVAYEKIKNLPNVVECFEDSKIPLPNISEEGFNHNNTKYPKNDKEEITDNKNENEIYYNITDIKIDTQWSDVSIQRNASFHLSLISQSKVDFNLVNEYDHNFYYPTTAGEGVDIYILDNGGINTNHIDFDTTYRTVTCDGETKSYSFIEYEPYSPKSTNCTVNAEEQYHGTAVASAAAGTIYGVAKKANIHVITINFNFIDYLTALNYIIEKAKDPHKTIINMSFGGYRYRSIFDKQLNVLVNKGFMIFAAAGNGATNACSIDIRDAVDKTDNVNDKFYPAGYIDVIAVGGINNKDEENIYIPAKNSNYGSCVDFFAPFYVDVASVSNENEIDKKQSDVTNLNGTSLSSPIVAGVAATLISEHPEITFNQDIMKQMLIDLSIKGAINDLDRLYTPNRLINIGKKVVYSANDEYKGCGIGSGKKSCSHRQCCSARGYCGYKAKYCEIDCQSEYGYCSINNHSSLEKTKIKPEYSDVLIFNYYNDLDMCVKYVPSNNINKNIIMTVCDKVNLYNINNIWNIINVGNTKISNIFYEDTCINLDENGLVYADNCENGAIFKDIITVGNKDSIQSDIFPGKCLKAVETDYDPYGITIFTERHGVRVMMGDCDNSDDSQHWRFRDVPEPFDEDAYFDDDYIDEESKLPRYNDIIEVGTIYDKEIIYGGGPVEKEILYDRYGQIIDLNEYIEYNIFKKSVVTNTKKVWIYNEELNLCLTSFSSSTYEVRLKECDKNDIGQLWYVPDNNKGYYINIEYDISIIYTPRNTLVYGGYMETITLSKKYVKNHSSVITYEDELLKIYDKFHGEEVCFNIPEEEKLKIEVFVNMVPCNETTTHWKLTTEYPLK